MKNIYLVLTLVILSQNGWAQYNYTDRIDSKPDYTIKSRNLVSSDDCSYYLKYPPIVNSMILTENCYKKMALHVKEEFSNYKIELKLRIYDPGGYKYTDYIYSMHDDGAMGDEIAGDNIYTNNRILFTYDETKSYQLKTIYAYSNFIKNEVIVHTDRNGMNFLNVNKDFLDGLRVPNVKYIGRSGEIMWSNNFIYTIKNENWKELNLQSLCNFDYDYIESQKLLFNYWNENEIFNNKDDLIYCQIDFVEPFGQYAYTDGNSMYLSSFSIFGPLVHELLHRWIPAINDKLGLLISDSHSGHHPNIFRNTSGFLYSTWSRYNGIFFKDQVNNIVKLNDSIQYVYTDFNAPPKIDETKRQQFNDYEMYLIGLIPIDSVNFPIYFLKDLYNSEYLVDPISGYAVGKKDYFKELVEINQQQLFEAKNQMLADYPLRTNFNGKVVKVLPVFTGSHFLTIDEIKMVNLLAEEIATKSEPKLDKYYMDFQTYYQATKGKGEIILYVPEPKLTSVKNNIKFVQKIYPNPTTGLLQIEGLPENDITMISIYSTLGQIIEQIAIVNSNATINLTHYKKGIYYLRFNNNFNSAIKIIKE
jgi:hypothetical protein